MQGSSRKRLLREALCVEGARAKSISEGLWDSALKED